MKFWKNCALFCMGGGSYVCLELLWRRRSHGSMFLLGGACFLVIGAIRRLGNLALSVRVALSAAAVTALELLTGLAVNRDHKVWDYRRLPFQFRGQICLYYSLLWLPVSLLAMGLHRLAERKLDL